MPARIPIHNITPPGNDLLGRTGCERVWVTAVTGTAEREASLLLLAEAAGAVTVGGDKGFDVPSE